MFDIDTYTASFFENFLNVDIIIYLNPEATFIGTSWAMLQLCIQYLASDSADL